MNRIQVSVICGALLLLVGRNASASLDPGNDGGGPLNPVVWSAHNVHGTGTSNLVGYSDSNIIQTDFQSTVGRHATVTMDYEHSNWSMRDSVDSISFQEYGSGWKLERTKIGRSGKHIVVFDSGGHKISETDTLHAAVSDEFAQLQQEFNDFNALLPPPTYGLRQSCVSTMVLGGLAIVGESMLYAASWTNPLVGIVATPVYIVAVMQTNEWVVGACSPGY